jgi:hypothetical protein
MEAAAMSGSSHSHKVTVAFAAVLALPALLFTRVTPPPDPPPTAPPSAIQVFGAWHCGNDYCTWGSERDASPDGEFDRANHWLVDRDPTTAVGDPSVNLVVLSFVHPLKLLNLTTDPTTVDGVPRGMTPEVVRYFTTRGVRVMLSIGGITYTDAWNQALATDAARLGLNAAAVATRLGVGIEIDYEQNSDPDLVGLQDFIDAYRSEHPYDATGADPAARLTIDLAAGDRWLIALTRKATADWLRTDSPVLDYANAMVPARQPRSASDAISNWQEHIDGKPQYAPPIPSLAPAKFTGGLYVALGSKVLPECNAYAKSLQSTTRTWVQSAAPKNGVGTTPGLLGYMFWAAEKPATRGIGTVPPNTCEGGMGVAATQMPVPLPMPALRQG